MSAMHEVTTLTEVFAPATPSQTTVARETTSSPFTLEEYATLIPTQVMQLEPERVRDALSEAYSAVFAAGSGRPNANSIRDRLVYPFLFALPALVEKHGAENESLRKALAEILNIAVGCRLATNGALVFRHTYGLSETEEDIDDAMPVNLVIPNVRLMVGQTTKDEIAQLAARGGVWATLSDANALEALNASDPVSLLNWIAEFRQYSSTVSFKVKLEGQQLKMLQAFFRSI